MSDNLLVRCQGCGARNRVPRHRVIEGETVVCGRCREPLSIHLSPVTVTDMSFAADVERSPLPVVLDVWAAWCGPCRMLALIVDELASELAGQMKFAKAELGRKSTHSQSIQRQQHTHVAGVSSGRTRGRDGGSPAKAAPPGSIAQVPLSDRRLGNASVHYYRRELGLVLFCVLAGMPGD